MIIITKKKKQLLSRNSVKTNLFILNMTIDLATTQDRIKQYIVETSHADANKIKNEVSDF